jgi:hypothetical protein
VLTVVDVSAPVLTCPVSQFFCVAAGNNYTIPLITATDNCTPTVSINYTFQITGATTRSGTGTDASGTFNTGVSTITWTVNDGCGNNSTCATTVTISVPPTATISYPADPYCNTSSTPQVPTLTGTGAYTGGTYSAVPSGLAIKGSTGAITPSGSSNGN